MWRQTQPSAEHGGVIPVVKVAMALGVRGPLECQDFCEVLSVSIQACPR